MSKTKANNIFDSFLNECQTYVWEWYIPEQKVRFGIPSLNSLWIDDRSKNIKLATMLERVHPDDIQKVLVRHTSPLYRSDKMFEVDLRLNVAAELMPDGKTPSGKYEWYGFRGKTITRDRLGRPTYVRGVAINLDERYRAQLKLLNQKERHLKSAKQKNDYCTGVMQEMSTFLRSLAENANKIIDRDDDPRTQEECVMLVQDLAAQAERIIEMSDKFRQIVGAREMVEDQEIRALSLWEHLAEQQQIFSLKGPKLKIYFSNLYDNRQIYVNVKLFDVLLENIIAPQRMLRQGGSVTISYSLSPEEDTVTLLVVSKPDQVYAQTQEISNDVGLGMSVCRLLAKRMWGSIQVKRLSQGQVQYSVTIPVDARQLGSYVEPQDKDPLDEQDETDEQEKDAEDRSMLPHVLIGLTADAELYQNQHLFDVSICANTDATFKEYEALDPDIVFIDHNLPGQLSVNDLIRKMSALHPDTPIVVSSDFAERSLHKLVQQLGARYLLTNPLSLRKVNMMIKKYLK